MYFDRRGSVCAWTAEEEEVEAHSIAESEALQISDWFRFRIV